MSSGRYCGNTEAVRAWPSPGKCNSLPPPANPDEPRRRDLSPGGRFVLDKGLLESRGSGHEVRFKKGKLISFCLWCVFVSMSAAGTPVFIVGSANDRT